MKLSELLLRLMNQVNLDGKSIPLSPLLVVLAFGVACSGMAGLPQAVAGQEASLSGTWRYQGGVAEHARRHEAIDRATKGMGFLIRDRVRQRLREATMPAQQLTVADEGSQVTITMRGRQVTLRTDGSPKPVSGEGRAATMHARRQNGQLVVTIRGETGTRTTVYRLSDDGRGLILDVALNGERLSEPLRYRTNYRRHDD